MSDMPRRPIQLARWLAAGHRQGQSMVVMTNSDNGSILAEALIRRAAELHGWPLLGALED